MRRVYDLSVDFIKDVIPFVRRVPEQTGLVSRERKRIQNRRSGTYAALVVGIGLSVFALVSYHGRDSGVDFSGQGSSEASMRPVGDVSDRISTAGLDYLLKDEAYQSRVEDFGSAEDLETGDF